jgi:hypothetical protein
MLRRITVVAFATALFIYGLFVAGSALSTALTLGLLIFLAIVTVMIGWDNLKESIVEEVEQAQRQVIPRFTNQESVDAREFRSWSLIQTDPAVRFHASARAEIDATPAQLASSFHSGPQLPYETR